MFPADAALKKEWILAVKRSATNNLGGASARVWQPTQTSVVCKAHFKPNDYISETVYGNK